MSDTTMSSIRPEGATHTDSAGSYYKPGVELNWYRWNGERGNWFICGTMPSGSLTPLPPVQVVKLDAFDAPAPQLPSMPEPLKDPYGVYKVQLTRWQADDGSFHESYEDAVRHGVFKDLKSLMHEFMDHGEIEVEAFITSLLEHYNLERK